MDDEIKKEDGEELEDGITADEGNTEPDEEEEEEEESDM